MSEKSFEDVHDRLMREAFRKLEQDKEILTGSAFKKWRNHPSGLQLMPVFLFPVLGVIVAISHTEARALPLTFFALVAAMSFSTYQMQIINKRIDKIVQATGAERKLEEECQATINQIAGLESKKADA